MRGANWCGGCVVASIVAATAFVAWAGATSTSSVGTIGTNVSFATTR